MVGGWVGWGAATSGGNSLEIEGVLGLSRLVGGGGAQSMDLLMAGRVKEGGV